VLFANDSMRLYFEYYLRRDPGLALPTPEFPKAPWGEFTTGDHEYVSFDVDDVRRSVELHDETWLVVETGLLEHPEPALQRVLDTFQPTVVEMFPRTAVVFRISRLRFQP
jgi:hypothetical protein